MSGKSYKDRLEIRNNSVFLCSTLMFEVGINKDYIKLLIDQTYGGEGAEYTGERDLLEYTVGDITIDNLSNDTSNDYGQVEVISKMKCSM